ncbi:MAG: hypothetical protein EOR84_29580 [Mesorhizobium sp.]|uniref:hypothetical protein n=1 Tax=Mesorhizobium sp. TaxID=1871066 RepID=UPI000FE64B7E|nr:hypothetical protein [Mesorhizobium sp.]RWM87442.1 MAG: hypothetical protein EOR84_29580 [Mesorhizobium sp.]
MTGYGATVTSSMVTRDVRFRAVAKLISMAEMLKGWRLVRPAREVLLAAHHPSPKPASSTETSLVPTISGLRCTYSPATCDKPTVTTARRIGCR